MNKCWLLFCLGFYWSTVIGQGNGSTVPTAIYVGNALFQAPVEGAKVRLVLQEDFGDRRRPISTPIGEFQSDESGMVTVSLIPEKQYLVQTSKDGYYTQLSKIKTTNFSRTHQNRTGISLRPKDLVSIKGNIALLGEPGEEEGRRITLVNKDTRYVRTGTVDANGDYDIQVMKGSDYELHIYVEGLVDTIITVEKGMLASQSAQLPVVFNIVPGAPRPNFRAGDVLTMTSYNLRFIDRTVRPSSEVWMDTLTRILRDYPDVKIEVQVHTDARKSDRLNLLLSKRRAVQLEEEFKERGIRAKQYTFEYKGEDHVLNGCVDGVSCSRRAHAINNRVTLSITAGAFYFKDN